MTATAAEVTILSIVMRKKFEKQFPDLIDNHVAWMCFREGYQHGFADALYGDDDGDL